MFRLLFLFCGGCMREKAIKIIQQYLDELNMRRIDKYRSESFEQRSYSMSAAENLLELLENDNITPPIILIEDFIGRMDDYACVSKVNSIIFSVAYDTALCILDMILE